MFCPKCGKDGATVIGEAFIETGHFSGDYYEAEGHAPVYKCGACRAVFAADIPDLLSVRVSAVTSALEAGGYDMGEIDEGCVEELANRLSDALNRPIEEEDHLTREFRECAQSLGIEKPEHEPVLGEV